MLFRIGKAKLPLHQQRLSNRFFSQGKLPTRWNDMSKGGSMVRDGWKWQMPEFTGVYTPVLISAILGFLFALPLYWDSSQQVGEAKERVESIKNEQFTNKKDHESKLIEAERTLLQALANQERCNTAAITRVLFGICLGIAYSVANCVGVATKLRTSEQILGETQSRIAADVSLYGKLTSASFLQPYITAIVKHSSDKGFELDQLSAAQREKVQDMITVEFNHFEQRARQFAAKTAIVKGGLGRELDRDLVRLAELSINASTWVNKESMAFWRGEPGEDYRAECRDAVARLAEKHGASETRVRRIFTLGIDDLQREGDEGRELINKVVAEIKAQVESGIHVRVALSDRQNSGIDEIDVLVVDERLSSKTMYLQHSGDSRSVEFNWLKPLAVDYYNQWRSLWERGLSPEQFFARHGIPYEQTAEGEEPADRGPTGDADAASRSGDDRGGSGQSAANSKAQPTPIQETTPTHNKRDPAVDGK